MSLRALATAALLLASPALAIPAAAQTMQRIRGTVTALQGDTLTVTPREGGSATIHLAPGYTVTAVVPATMADVKPGAYIGIAAVGPKERLRALEVHIFADSQRGTGEGFQPWDSEPGSSMTNATLESEVAAADGRTLMLTAKGERLPILVPPGTPIVAFQPGSPAMLTPGAHVIVAAQKAADGTLSAARISAGKDGLTPPM